jgi:hypothetical protein
MYVLLAAIKHPDFFAVTTAKVIIRMWPITK